MISKDGFLKSQIAAHLRDIKTQRPEASASRWATDLVTVSDVIDIANVKRYD